jgi:hypothetical protein
MNISEKALAYSMKKSDFVSIIALFGWGRHTKRLNADYTPLSYREIDEEAARYGEYRRNFGIEQASNPALSYLVVPTDWNVDFTNIDKWYERGEPEFFDAYTLYEVKLK